MWMLVRAENGVTAAVGGTTLAGCPDTAGRGDPWRWSVRLVPDDDDAAPAASSGRGDVAGGAPVARHAIAGGGTTLELLVDPGHVAATADVLCAGRAVDLLRRSGSQLVIVPLEGEALVTDSTGPWQRWLSPGDVFVVEGEEPESLRLTPSPEPSRVAVLTLTPVSGQPLRWVP